MEHLSQLFTFISERSLWGFIWNYSRFKTLRKAAAQAFTYLLAEQQKTQEDQISAHEEIQELLKSNDEKQRKLEEQERALTRERQDLALLKQNQERKDSLLEERAKKIQHYQATEAQRIQEHEQRIAELNQIKATLDKEIEKIHQDRLREIEDRHEAEKATWRNHEKETQRDIKDACRLYDVTFCNKPPMKNLRPDNVIEINGQYIVFDAKSPQGEDLSNFPNYIKDQVKKQAKYAKLENVRKDVYLVVPTNTLPALSQLTYNVGTYNVYVIARDCLAPIVKTLREMGKIEVFKDISPERRDEICRIVAKLSYLVKRRVVVDQAFTEASFAAIAYQKDGMHDEMQQKIEENIKGEKLILPADQKTQSLSLKDMRDKANLQRAQHENLAEN